jgi:hypothetical protein
MWGALSDERTGCRLQESQSAIISLLSYVQFIFYTLLNVCIHNIYRASVSPGSVQFNSQCESESYVTTDSQPASLSWNKATFWGLRPDLYYCLTVGVY